MKKSYPIFILVILVLLVTFTMSGCTIIFQKGRRVDVEKISRLKGELSELERAKIELENRLKQEINDSEVNIEMLQKGLVITFVAEVLFDSGKDKLRASSLPKLDKVSKVLKTTVKDHSIGIEGHTDNVPIHTRQFPSNWELSSARAMSVIRFLHDAEGIDAKKLAAVGHGEYRPLVPNTSPERRARNRRVEIFIKYSEFKNH